MASLRMRVRKDGSVYASVLFRECGKQSSVSFDDINSAKRFQSLVERIGSIKAKEVIMSSGGSEESTLSELILSHIDGLTGVQKGTVDQYRGYFYRDIEPILGHLPVSAVTRIEIGKWIQSLSGSGKTIANKHGFLSSVFKEAIRNGIVSSNPCAGIKLPKTQKREIVFLSSDDFQKIHDVMLPRWRPLAVWLAVTGMRFSEATALQVRDIDLENQTCRINKAWKHGKDSEMVIGVPKTKKSIRTINVASQGLVVLDLDKPLDALVFSTKSGNRITNQSFHDLAWQPAIRKSGLAYSPRVHDLRHSCASWMIQAGVPLPVVQAHLGHESIQTTVDVYGHLDRRTAKLGAAAIEATLANFSS